jgi:hypothetical protein
MPDLTTEYAWTCETSRQWEIIVPSSNGQTQHTVRWERLYDADRASEFDYTCTCKGFATRGTCKHVTTVKSSGARCAWDDRFDGGDFSYDTNGKPCCPNCAAPVFSYSFGA